MVKLKEFGSKALVLTLAVTVLFGVSLNRTATAKTELKVLNAGSLMVPFDRIEDKFEETHPDVDVQIEGHGSIQVVRHVTEIHDRVDVTAVADYSLVPLLMYETNLPNSDKPYADWYIKFATNNLGLAYTETSSYSEEITADNWYEVLLRDDVNFGMSDPRMDACGYRALMLTRLAEDYYGKPDLFGNLITDSFKNYPIESVDLAGMEKILVPRILQPRSRLLTMRGSSINLLAPLEAGGVDYGFQYESVARQHGLSFLRLPPQINLGSEEYSENYRKVQVKLDYQRFSSVSPVFTGRRLLYGITIPENAPHPELAREFVEFVLTEPGREVMENSNHPTLEKPAVDGMENLPEQLKELNLKEAEEG